VPRRDHSPTATPEDAPADEGLTRSERVLILPARIGAEGRELSGEVPAAVFAVAEDSLSFPEPLAYELRAENLGTRMVVKGRVWTAARRHCDSCLAEYDEELQNDEVCHLLEDVGEDEIDLTDDLREDALVVLPQKSLCSEECRGLCPQCGQNLNEQDCGCPAPDSASDAWSKLNELKL